MKKTKIEWADSTWNPVTGCLHGCEYCYARKIAKRFDGKMNECNPLHPSPLHELKEASRKGKITTSGEVITKITPYPFGFEPTFHRYRLDEYIGKTRRNIFVCSMADLFGDWVPDEWIREVFDTCDEAPQHRYLFLTKNPDRYGELYKKDLMPKGEKSWNKWYGCSITNPHDEFFWIDEDAYGIDHYGFLSIEPLHADFPSYGTLPQCIRWVIIGAETGHRKDRVIPKKEWIDHICEAAGKSDTPVFMKDSLVPIVGEENMRREFPWDKD